MKRVRSLFVLWCVVLLVGSAVTGWAQEAAPAQKKALLVIAANDFRDDEFFPPQQILQKAGVAVTVASSVAEAAKGSLGATVDPDILLKDAVIADYDALVFIGGMGATQYFDDADAKKLITEAVAQDKIVAAICIAPMILAKAGVLNGKNATVVQPEAENFKSLGVQYTGKSVERDGKFITADGPQSAEAFGNALREALQE